MYSPELVSRPTLAQMNVLQTLGMVLAKEQKKIKKSRKAAKAYIFLAQEVKRPETDSTSESAHYSTHRFTGRIGRVGPRQWSLKVVVEAFWIRQAEKDWDDGFRASYTFEWTDKGVYRAVKNVKARTLEEEYESYAAEKPADALEQIEHWAGFWEGVGIIETVSQADCECLISEMEIFSRVSRQNFSRARV